MSSAALEAIEEYSDNPSAFLALDRANQHFAVPGLVGVITYRVAGHYLVQLTGPFAPPADYTLLLRRFLDFARRQRRRVVAVQLLREDAEIYAAHGFTVNQVGSSYAVDLERFTLAGSRFMRLRNKISRAKRSGLAVQECDSTTAPPAELVNIDREWLRSKGSHARELTFLVSGRDGSYDGIRRLFVGSIDGTPVAYIRYAPVFGTRPGWMHELSRRRAEVPPGVMEAINAAAIDRFRAEGVGWLHFGFTPFTGLDAALDVPTASPLVRRIVTVLAEHGDALYPARSQLAYKEKWAPHVVLPEYVAFQDRPRAGAILQLLRITNVV